MNRSRFVILIALVLAVKVSAQTVYYYELANGKGDGHFVTITKRSCYDSDYTGVSLENGVRLYKGIKNNQYLYYGMSVFGDASYYFSLDYKTLNIETDKGDKYNYIRKETGSKTASNHGIVPEKVASPKIVPVTIPIYPTSAPSYGGNIYSTPTQSQTHRSCAGCGGSGLCTMCNGKGWYNYYGSSYTCSSCNRTGRCGVCHGKGTCY